MPEPGEPLSQRELEVLQYVSSGASNKEIAAALTISQNTVKVHLRNIFEKLGVSSRTEATTAAIQHGLIVMNAGSAAPSLEMGGSPGSQAGTSDSVLRGRAPQMEMAPGGYAPEASRAGRSLFSARNIVLFSTLVVFLMIMGVLGWQTFNGRAEPTPEPFEAVPIEDSGWFLNRQLPAGRANMAMAAVGLNVYQIAGETERGLVRSVRVYDTVNHIWSDAANKPTAVASATAAVLFGEIYVPGGRLAEGQPTDIVEAYSPTNDAWRSITSLPQPVAGGLALSDGSFLYLLGGWDGKKYLDTAYLYDVAADSWRPLPAMKQARAFAAGSVITGQLYVVGGFDGQAELATCQLFDTTSVEWRDCPDMLLPRAGAGAAVVLNRLYIIGGGLEAGREVMYSEVYDPNSQTWQVVNTPMLSADPSWTFLGVTNVEVRIYAMGGRHGDLISADNYTYAPRVFRTFIPAATTGDED